MSVNCLCCACRLVDEASIVLVKMFLCALGGPWFWFVFTFAAVFECSVEVMQPWLLGAWATQYETHKPEDVDVPLYVYSR